MLDLIWLVPALIAVGLIVVAYLVGKEAGRQEAAIAAARHRHPANRTYSPNAPRCQHCQSTDVIPFTTICNLCYDERY